MAAVIELYNAVWSLIESLFDPTGRQGAPATYTRREMERTRMSSGVRGGG
jgi:hypothetical protein